MGRKKIIIKEVIEPQLLLKDDVLIGKINFPTVTEPEPEEQIEPVNEPIELKPINEPESDTDSLIVANKKGILVIKQKMH